MAAPPDIMGETMKWIGIYARYLELATMEHTENRPKVTMGSYCKKKPEETGKP